MELTQQEQPGSASEIIEIDSSGPYKSRAAEYIAEHKIIEFFENLTAALVYKRPDDPKEFAKDFIQQLLKVHEDPDENDPPCLMEESNLESIFGMLDITSKGHITQEQYLKAMENLGVKKFNQNPLGGNLNKITLRAFIREAQTALKGASATFRDY